MPYSSEFIKLRDALDKTANIIEAVRMDTDDNHEPSITYLYYNYKGNDSVLFGLSEHPLDGDPKIVVSLSWVTKSGKLSHTESAQVSSWLDNNANELFEKFAAMIKVCLGGDVDKELLKLTLSAFEAWGLNFGTIYPNIP